MILSNQHLIFAFQVRAKKFDESIETLRRAIDLQSSLENSNAAVGRNVAGIVMVQLMREDSIAASKAFTQYGAYCDGDTAPALRALLAAFDEEDGDAAKEALNSSAIKNLDIDFARLAKQIKLPTSELEAAAAQLGAQRAAASEAADAQKVVAESKALEEEAAAASVLAPVQPPADDEDDEDDLC